MSPLVAGRYELDDPPAHGSMGEVHTAYDLRLDRRVALKRPHPDCADDQEMLERFAREARLTARVSHPGIPITLDYGTDKQGPYLVLEYIDGCTLEQLHDELGHLPVGWIAAIGAQICAILDHTHAASLIHRDLKPANILLRADGTVAIIDFGIAAVIGASRLTTLTAPGAMVGTATYQAPERRLGVESPLTDLYAVGRILHRLGAADPDNPLAGLVEELTAPHPQDRPQHTRGVVGRLRTHIGPLGPLPGFVPDAHRLTERVTAFIAATPTSPARPAMQATLTDLPHLRRRAERLATDGRSRQAIELLDLLIDLSSAAGDPIVLDLRWDRARYLAEAGLSARLAGELTQLTGQLAERLGAQHPAVATARLMLAQAQAARGRVREALAVLRSLLADQAGGRDRYDPALYPVRLEYGIQLAVAGEVAEARTVLDALAEDQRDRLGPHHPDLAATLDARIAL